MSQKTTHACRNCGHMWPVIDFGDTAWSIVRGMIVLVARLPFFWFHYHFRCAR